MKNALSVTLIIFSLFIVGFSLYNSKRQSSISKKYNFYKDELIREKQLAQLNIENMTKLFEMNLLSSNSVLNDITVFDEEENELNLSSLFNGRAKVVLRYSEINCKSCIDTSIFYLRKNIESIGRNNIVILSSYRRHKDLMSFKRINNLTSIEVYNTGFKKLSLPIENAEIPYYFIVDKNLNCQDVFSIELNSPNLLDMYFKIIISKYFSN